MFSIIVFANMNGLYSSRGIEEAFKSDMRRKSSKNEGGAKRSFRGIVADMGYASEENYTYLESNSQNAYIKPADHIYLLVQEPPFLQTDHQGSLVEILRSPKKTR